MADATMVRYDLENQQIPALPLKAKLLTASDSVTYHIPISIEVKTAGDLVVVPFLGEFDGTETAITIPAAVAVAGYRPMFRVKMVKAATTAVVIGAY